MRVGLRDKAGNIYGTTQLGGGNNYNDCGDTAWGCGTVFELSPLRKGKWKESVLLAPCAQCAA